MRKIPDIKNLNLLEDKYFYIYVKMPFDLYTLHMYLNVLVDSADVKLPKTFKKYSVTHWVSDSKGKVYDYKDMLISIYDNIRILEGRSNNINMFLKRIMLELDKLELSFKNIIVVKKSKGNIPSLLDLYTEA